VRVAFVDAHRDRWPVAAMCRAIGLSERTYHARKRRPLSPRAVRDEELKPVIRKVFEDNYSCYGARRVWLALRRNDIEVARCTVERLMADMGIHGVQRGKKLFTTIADADAARPPDLVNRQFVAERPNQLWLADITYCSTWEGWLYVSFILDCYSRMIVGWQIASHMRTELVLDALEMAIFRRDVTGPLTHHSDAGSQFTAIRYSDRLTEAAIAASIGSVGDSYDNAMAEALNGTFKAELVKLHGPWRTRAQLETAIINWIYWYNETRLHGEIGDIPPAELEATWYAADGRDRTVHSPCVTIALQ
jgi:transposase InsO family protein